jgi:hypothetical protein|tara:strand:+ start:369 stop:779 length:411 start_codon:yes stop_codon:yes gene_type:complete
LPKRLASLYKELENLSADDPRREEVTFRINKEKALLAREERPPEDFGALREVIRSILKEVLTPSHHTIKSWRKLKAKRKISNKEWVKDHPASKWVLRHSKNKKATKNRKGFGRGDVYRGPDTYKKVLAILRAEKAG